MPKEHFYILRLHGKDIGIGRIRITIIHVCKCALHMVIANCHIRDVSPKLTTLSKEENQPNGEISPVQIRYQTC